MDLDLSDQSYEVIARALQAYGASIQPDHKDYIKVAQLIAILTSVLETRKVSGLRNEGGI